MTEKDRETFSMTVTCESWDGSVSVLITSWTCETYIWHVWHVSVMRSNPSKTLWSVFCFDPFWSITYTHKVRQQLTFDAVAVMNGYLNHVCLSISSNQSGHLDTINKEFSPSELPLTGLRLGTFSRGLPCRSYEHIQSHLNQLSSPLWGWPCLHVWRC